ncbi:hypothetical protein FPOA_12383 [Fusarium poae]|uniref:Integrase catalytic domain-containing protein n=1 Tax=Fusarium poae TaxID=36050 RepID=A0A1B8A9G2_FUSPO|nr:hypothetical protein FPOA_12383 [Fusarium poae]
MSLKTIEQVIGLDSVSLLEGPGDWSKWKRAIRIKLGCAGYGDLFMPTTSTQTPDNMSRQTQATYMILSRCGYNAQEVAEGKSTVAEMMETLRLQFEPKGSVEFTDLARKWRETSLNQFDNVSAFGQEIRDIAAGFARLSSECKLSEPHIVDKFLTSLGPTYDTFLTVFYQNHDIVSSYIGDSISKKGVTLNDALRLAEQEERRQKQQDDNKATQTALLARRGNFRHNTRPRIPCKICNRTGHKEEDCWIRHPEKRREWERKYPERAEATSRARKQQWRNNSNTSPTRQNSPEGEAAMAATQFLNTAFISVLDNFAGTAQSRDNAIQYLSKVHILDSGATSHMMCKSENFDKLSNVDESVTGLGGAKTTTKGRGTYRLWAKNESGRAITLSNSLLVPDGHVNLVSVSQLSKNGAQVVFNDKKATVTRDNKTVFTATMRYNMYIVDEEGIDYDVALSAHTIQDQDLAIWHKRLNHLSEQGIKKLSTMVTGMNKGTRPFESLHADIAGPFPVTGLNGERYWVTFTDDFTQMTWVFPLKQKSEFIDKLKFLVNHHKSPSRQCKCIRLDKGGENVSNEVQLFCQGEGIEIVYTNTEQHQQNGIAERMNRTILEKLTTTLLDGKIPHIYWPYVLKGAVWSRNLSPHSTLPTTPYEQWTHEVPDIQHLRIPGSLGFVRLTDSKKRKMDPVSVPCKLLACSGFSTYIILTSDNKVISSNDVVFDEQPLMQLYNHHPTAHEDSQSKRHKNNIHTDLITIQQTRLDNDDASRQLQEEHAQQNIPDNNEDPIQDTIIVQTDTRVPQLQDAQVNNHIPAPAALERHHELQLPRQTRSSRGQPRYALVSNEEPRTEHTDRLNLLTTHIAMAARSIDLSEPRTYKQATQSPSFSQWKEAMTDELQSLEENKTWTMVNAPDNVNILRGKWVYKVKRGGKGEILRHKARFVVRGFEQEEGIDYHETFASVVKPMSYKAIFAIAAALDLEVEQMDVKTAFLYGDIDEDIYISQPEGFQDGTDRVCKLNKALYGLKQAPRIWYTTLSSYLAELGFKPLWSDVGVFVKGSTFIAVYVDDLLLVGPHMQDIKDIKSMLFARFKMTDLGPCEYYLGMSVRRDRPNQAIYLSQSAYIQKVLEDFELWDSNANSTPVATSKFNPPVDGYKANPDLKTWYARAIGSLMYAMLGTRPDIAYGVSLCSRFLGNPTEEHKMAVKRIMRYLRGTVHLELRLQGQIQPPQGYTDADWGGDQDTRRSTGGYIFNFGSGAISWSSKRQPTVALSSCEAEYMVQTQATKEAIWLRRLFEELMAPSNVKLGATIIFGDNQGAIAMAKNPTQHAKSKHIGIQHHFVREQVALGEIELQYISTKKQVADGLTKPLPKVDFLRFRSALGLIDNSTSDSPSG